MSKRSALILLSLIIIVAVGFRAYNVTARSLWFDEAFSWRLIQFSIPELISRTAADVHPPLYYVVLKGWSIVFGSSLLSLRSFSIAGAATTVAAGYLFVSSAARSRGAGLLVAALLALSGWQIQFAAEARMYTLGATFAFLSSWALLRAVRSEPQQGEWWALYAVLASLFAYIHYYAFFTLAAHALFVAGYLLTVTGGRAAEIVSNRRFWYAAMAAVGATLLYFPWLPIVVRQNSQVQASYWIPAIGGWSIPDTFYRMWIPTAKIPQHTGLGWIALAVVPILATFFLAVVVVLLGRGKKATKDARWLMFALSLTPFLLSILVSLVSQSLYQDRFFVFAHLFILSSLAVFLTDIRWPSIRAGAVVVALLGFGLASVNFWFELAIPQKPGVRAAAAYMYEENSASSAPVIVSSPFIYFAVLHYATEYFAAPAPHLYSEKGTFSHFAGGPILRSDDIVGPTIFATPSSTLWVVTTTGFGGSTIVPPAPWRSEETRTYPEVFAHQGEVTVTRYTK